MPRPTMDGVIQQIRHLAEGSRRGLVTDQQLLERFIGRRDDAAFAALVRRHGPMILGLCRRLLQHVQDAEDVFQASFLVLARKAAAIRKQESVGSWLYGVAYRLALKAKAEAAKRRRGAQESGIRSHGSGIRKPSEADPLAEISWREVCTALDEELARLPDRCRAPLVLCYLESKTQDEALHHLGWSKSTFRRRLEEGRKRLCSRLTRRGITLSAGLWATVLSDQGASAALPSALSQSTVQAAIVFSAGEVAGCGTGVTPVSPQVTLLVKEGLKAAVMSKMKWVALVGMVTAVTTGMGLAARQALTANQATGEPKELLVLADEQRDPPPAPSPTGGGREGSGKANQARVDRYGDPLPEGAIARLGTIRWRTDGHGVDAMAVTADGKSLLTANTETGITIWDMVSGKAIQRIPQKRELHKEWFGQTAGLLLSLSGDGRSGFFMPDDGTIYVIDIATGKEVQSWKNHRSMSQRALASGDGKILVTRSYDAMLQIWSTDSGKLLRELSATPKQDGQSKLHWLAISGDGKTLAWIAEDNACPIHVVELATGKELYQLGEHDRGERQIVMSPNGEWLVSTSGSGLVQLWDLKNVRIVHKWTGKERMFLPMAAFSPDSQKLVLTRPGDAMRVLEVATGKELWQVPRRISSTGQDFYAFTPDGKTLLVAGGALGTVIHRYETATGKRLLAPGEPSDATREITFDPHERTVYTLGADGSVLRSWEARTGKELSQTHLDIRWGKFAPEGQLLAGAKDDGMRVFQCSTGKELWHLKAAPPLKPRSWCFSPDGKLLAVFGEQQGQRGYAALLWDLTTGKESRRFSIGNSLGHFAFAADGKSVVAQPWPSNSEKGRPLRFWDVSTSQERLPVNLPPNNGILTLSPDGKTIVVMQDPPMMAFIEVATGQKRMEIHVSEVCRIWTWPPTATYSLDGRSFLLSDGEGQMQVLDSFSGQRIRTVSGHSGSFSSYAFSRSGGMLATLSSSDTTGLVWDATTIVGSLRAGSLGLSPDELSALWDDLGSQDATRAYQAIGRLASAPRQVLPWLRQHLKPVSTAQVDKKRLNQHLAQLDSDDFAVRERATKELEKFGQSALPAFEQALEGKPSAEVRKRITELMERLAPERLRPLRAIEALEHIGNSEAQDCLGKLAQGAPEARLTQEAKASLERLKKRSTASP